MQWYADQPVRRARQVIADTVVATWVMLWVDIGREVHSRAAASGRLAARPLDASGRELTESMNDAGNALKRVPVVGDDLEQPFQRAAQTGGALSRASQDIQSGFDQIGLLLGLLVAALPISLVVMVWLLVRLRYVKKVRTARALDAAEPGDIEALRQMLGVDNRSLGLRPRTSGCVVERA